VNGHVVVDASLAFKWLVKEDRSDEARSVARSWEGRGVRTAAPHFMPVEVANALHRRVTESELSVEEAVELVEVLLASGIELHDPPDLYGRAIELASLLSQGAVYDAHYLALAETLDCELWTADEKFFRAASAASRNVRWIGELVAPE
jgi:predicted nucleic acid-binding protein